MKKEWSKLKDNYRKTKAKREKATRSGAGNNKPLPTCNYFAELSFLSGSVSNRSVDSNIPTSILTPLSSPQSLVGNPLTVSTQSPVSTLAEDETDDISERNSISLSSPVDRAFESCTSSQTIKTPIPKKTRKRHFVDNDNADILLVKALDKHLNQTESVNPPVKQKQEEVDDNRLFCLSLVETLKGLDPRKNVLARIKIQQVLFDVKFDSA